MPIMQVYIVEGRSEAQKNAFIAALTEAAVATLGAPADTVRVLINELPAAHWGKGGKSIKQLTAGAAESESGS